MIVLSIDEEPSEPVAMLQSVKCFIPTVGHTSSLYTQCILHTQTQFTLNAGNCQPVLPLCFLLLLTGQHRLDNIRISQAFFEEFF